MSFAFVFPGQGSQSVGMMSAYAQAYPVVAELFQHASELLGVDLWKMTQEGPEVSLSMTEHTQPVLLTAGYAVWCIWKQEGGAMPAVMAGHSLGELTALTCAGGMRFEDAVVLVRDRGRFMQSAVPAGEGAMAVVIGLEDDAVTAACESYGEGETLQAVNLNAPGQVVVAGTTAAVQRLTEGAKDVGARRVMPLPVSIPAHSDLMIPAAEALADRLESVEFSVPQIPVVHNVNVQTSVSAEEIVSNLVAQARSPVRWVETIQSIGAGGVKSFVESGPGKVLSGLIKRINREYETYSLDDVESLPSVIDALR